MPSNQENQPYQDPSSAYNGHICKKKKLKTLLLKHMYESVSYSFPVGNSLGDPAVEPADTENWMLLFDPKCKEETQTLLSVSLIVLTNPSTYYELMSYSFSDIVADLGDLPPLPPEDTNPWPSSSDDLLCKDKTKTFLSFFIV